MIKAVCFDLDGLFFTKESFQRFKEDLAPNVAKEKRDFVLALSDQMKAFKSWVMSEEKYRSWAQQELWSSYLLEEISKIFGESYEVDEQVLNLAQSLKFQGYKLCICSNNFPTRINALQERYRFLELFDVAVFSFEVKSMKPNTKIFEVLIEESWCKAEEIVYSDDNEDKLFGAKNLWIQTFVFSSFEGFVEDLQKLWIFSQV